jgi:hypothetical protein
MMVTHASGIHGSAQIVRRHAGSYECTLDYVLPYA